MSGHASDCAVHNEPALPNGPCNCGEQLPDRDRTRMGVRGTFRKRPLEVQAARVDRLILDARYAWDDLPPWVREAYERGDVIFLNDMINVRTLEGVMEAPADWWIVQGVKDELYPCAPHVFAASFDPAGEAGAARKALDRSLMALRLEAPGMVVDDVERHVAAALAEAEAGAL